MKWIDIPPVWLLAFLMLAWSQSTWLPLDLSFGGAVADFLGGILVGGGVILMALAVYELLRHRTTVNPHGEPSQLVQTGIFSRMRNPIYLGDALILAGLVLKFEAVLSLPLIPIFVWVIEKRFIEPEENRMRRKYRMDFARYEGKVRRWL